MSNPGLFPTLNSPRLLLRPLQKNDSSTIFFMRTNDQVNRYLEGFRHQSLEESKAYVEKIIGSNAGSGIEIPSWYFWVIEEKQSGSFIGTICIWNFNKSRDAAEAGYVMLPEFQQKGYMREALALVLDFGFRSLKLREILAFTHHENTASNRLLDRAGFKLRPDIIQKAGTDRAAYSISLSAEKLI